MGSSRILVVGAGVVGLSCALRLAENGHEVAVLARDLPLETTSSVAAALWYPYRASPPDRVLPWSRRTFAELALLAERVPAAGVRLRAGMELLRAPSAAPWWREAVPHLDKVPRESLPAGYVDGFRLSLPVVDMTRYLPWLHARVEDAGATVTRAALSVLPAAPVVVNCSGLAAHALAHDEAVRPVRGQVLTVRQPGIEEWLLDQSHPEAPVYVVPREDSVVVGGTATADDWNLLPDPTTTAQILRRATTLLPALHGAELLGVRVGLRPVRTAVRLETQRRDDGTAVVHCYGHGGAGVTLSWGCADDVAAAVAGLI
ncbi:MAG: FAD-binding oxidoreductase [Actinomycetota bacterium]|nr:FAD-binding oxidoreductase [Actinomycetota bacterium]